MGAVGNHVSDSFEEYQVSPEWLASVRLLTAGVLLTGLNAFQTKAPRRKFSTRDFVSLLLFSLIGMLGVQYTYFKAIQYSGAAIATICNLQVRSSFYFLVFNKEKKINVLEVLLMVATFVGVFLIVAEGSLQTLNISTMGFAMGMASAVTLAFYTLQRESY